MEEFYYYSLSDEVKSDAEDQQIRFPERTNEK